MAQSIQDRLKQIDQQPVSGTPRRALLKLKRDLTVAHRGEAMIDSAWVHWLDDDADHWTSLPIGAVLQVQWIPRERGGHDGAH